MTYKTITELASHCDLRRAKQSDTHASLGEESVLYYQIIPLYAPPLSTSKTGDGLQLKQTPSFKFPEITGVRKVH